MMKGMVKSKRIGKSASKLPNLIILEEGSTTISGRRVLTYRYLEYLYVGKN